MVQDYLNHNSEKDFAKHMIMDLRNIKAFANDNKIEEGYGIEFLISKRFERYVKEDGIHWELNEI